MSSMGEINIWPLAGGLPFVGDMDVLRDDDNHTLCEE